MGAVETVLITGASSGIGRALAVEFGRHGHRLCLTGRNSVELAETAKLASDAGAAEVATYVADLATVAGTDGLLRDLKLQPISVLVHNAGFGVFGEFLKTDLAAERQLVELQIGTTLALTKALVPSMLARGRGEILNIGSVYAFSPVPRQSVYGACKAFMLSWAEALAAELEGTGVTVTTVCPGVTQSQFRRRSGAHEKSATSGMTADAVAKIAYRACRSGRRLVVPGHLNKIFVRACRAIPVTWVSGAVGRINRTRGLHD